MPVQLGGFPEKICRHLNADRVLPSGVREYLFGCRDAITENLYYRKSHGKEMVATGIQEPGSRISGNGTLRTLVLPGTILHGIAAAAILAGLILIGSRDYLLFHTIVEFAAIVVSFTIFLIIWNARRTVTDLFFVILGISFFFIGSLDLIHALAYKGMGVFPGDSANLPTQLWLAARYFQSITILIAMLAIGRSLVPERKYAPELLFAAGTAVSAILLASIFVWQNFPPAFIEGTGLTLFKIASEYAISLIILASVILLVLKRDHFDRSVWYLLVAALIFLIAGELAFTSYVSVYGFMNMVGHLFRLISVYLFYRAIVVVSFVRPFDILYRDLRRSEAALRDSEEEARAVLAAAKESIYLMDRRGIILVANATALERMGGLSPAEVVGRPFSDFLKPAGAQAQQERFDEVLSSGRPVQFMDERDGIILSHSFVPVFDEHGAVTRVATFSGDVTDRKRAEQELLLRNEDLNHSNRELTAMQEELRQYVDELTTNEKELRRNQEDLRETLLEKEVLLSEIHHRVKNNLAAFISLLSLDGYYEDTPAGQALRTELQNRARSMALVHETLYRTKHFSTVDMGVYLTTLVEQVAGSYHRQQALDPEIDADGIVLDISRATPCGLIVNELVTNSIKYAFPPSFDCVKVRGAPCRIKVSMKNTGGRYCLTVSDNGVGLPPGFDVRTARSLGMKMALFLARHQLRAEIEVKSNGGTAFVFRFSEEPGEARVS
jgi:PAS domain S-box-containing protein